MKLYRLPANDNPPEEEGPPVIVVECGIAPISLVGEIRMNLVIETDHIIRWYRARGYDV